MLFITIINYNDFFIISFIKFMFLNSYFIILTIMIFYEIIKS